MPEQQRSAPRRHLLISGTGRAGTSFLVVLLARLGCDTGFTPEQLKVDPRFRAGLEKDVRSPNAPYVIKSPWYCLWLGPLLEQGTVRIEHAIIPVRDFEAAAQSRVKAQEAAGVTSKPPPGGLWLTDEPDKQKAILYEQFGNLISVLVRHNVPITFLSYPRLVNQPRYLFGKLRRFLPGVELEQFLEVFNATVRRDWVSPV